MTHTARRRPELRDGCCCVCSEMPAEALALREQDVLICRPCAAALGRFLEAAEDSFLARLWGCAPPARTPDANVFQLRRARETTSRADASTHLDLGYAYADMGLASDAIRELAAALGPASPSAVAGSAFIALFAQPFVGWARPEALSEAIAAFRSSAQ